MCLWLKSLTAQDCSIIMVCMKIVQSSGPPCHLPAGLFRIFSLPVHHNTRHNLDSTTFSTTLYTEHLFQNLYSRQAALTNRSRTSKSRVAETRATPLPQFTGSTDPNFWQSSDCRKIGSLEPKVSHGTGRAKNKPEAVSLLLRSWCFSTSEAKKNHFFKNWSNLSEVAFSTSQNYGFCLWEPVFCHFLLHHFSLLPWNFFLVHTSANFFLSETCKK